MQTFSIQTFNAGLLTVFGKDIVPYVEERFEKIKQEIIDLDADIICLQEVFEKKHFEILKTILLPKYKFSIKAKGKLLFKSPGLCIFSKFPILEHTFTRFEDQQDIEMFTNHGFQKFSLNINSKVIDIFNIHLTAGGFTGNLETKRSSKVAQKQIKQIMQNIVKKENAFLIGDFNCGPRTDEDTYNLILEQDFIDVLQEQKLDDFLTWDNQNSVTAMQKFELPSDRIDHLFLNKNTDLGFVSACLNFNKIFPEIPYNLSDHFGICFKFEI